MDRTVARPDLGYLRRRPHRGEQPRAAASPAPAAGGGLSLRRGDGTPAGVATPRAAPAIPTARAHGRTVLAPELPTVTLDRRQSAIGTLAFDVAPHGRLNGVWELVDGTSGVVSDGGTGTSPEFGRRSLVELSRGRLLVGLRHVHRLRRLLVVLTDLDPQGSRTTALATLHDGATVESLHQGSVAAIASLALYQVDGELVVRREGFGFPSLAEAAAAYGFAASWTPPLHR
ncbi:hypothetical protein GCM10027047_34480 [Rhodococcus aerolatus]